MVTTAHVNDRQHLTDDQLYRTTYQGREHALVGDKYVDKLRADVVIIRIHDVYTLNELPFLKTQHTTRIREVKRAVLVVQIPRWCQLELSCAHHYRRGMGTGSSRSQERARDRDQSAVGEDGMRAEDNLVHVRHDRIDGRVWEER